MLTKDKQISLTELMQKNFSDLDIERDEPFKFRSGKYILVLETVKLLEHHQFLEAMYRLITRYSQIFYNVDFLSAQNFNETGAIQKLSKQVMVFQATKSYKKFIEDSMEFVARWGYVAKIKKNMVSKIERSPRLAKKVLREMTGDLFIYVLFLCFVRNYDIVKKNALNFLQLFKPDGLPQKETSSQRSRREVPQMPKYSPSPYPESVLKIFEEQSKMQ